MATNGNGVHQEQYGAAPAEVNTAGESSANATSESSTNVSHSKDEVGWFFVKQYYTTLSTHTSKLHLFYNKQSQFVQGPEAELVDVAVGRQDIQEAIKRLDFNDCKVRVANVDSQASYNNIVIQVIGEISNKGAEPKKFVQTFVLATQPQGYFLLNDIMRYINEGDEERVDLNAEEPTPAASAAAAEPEAPQELAAEAEPEKSEANDAPDALDAQAVDKKLEEASSVAKDTPTTSAVETPAEPAAEPAVAAQEAPRPEAAEPAPTPEKVLEEVAAEEISKPDLPKEPSPTPAPARAPAPEPVKPKEPAKPMSWASRVAATAPKPVVPLAAKTAAAPAQPRPAPPPAAAQPVAAQAPANKENVPTGKENAVKETKETKEESEWRLADSKRQSRQQSVAPVEKDAGTLAYVKFVTEKVKDDELRAALSAHGEMVYFDINRAKNCAFVEYATPAACLAIIKSSPITINGDSIVIEPRRPKAGAYGGANYTQPRGGAPGRGRGGFEGNNRSGSQGGGRGNFANNNRGRGGARGGRGGPQATTA